MANSYIRNMVDDLGLLLKSNESITKVVDETGMPIVPKTMFGAIPAGLANARGGRGQGYLKELEDAHRVRGKDGNPAGLNGAAIAGSFIAAGIGYRALSGGGVYRDSNGNTDVAGIPFI